MSASSLSHSKALKYGEHIFVYCHRRTNQILYSLTRSLAPRHLKQLVYLGKGSKPAAIRRDLWYPLATVSFTAGHGGQGLQAYHKLREFRKRHEHEWTHEELGTNNRKAAGQALMDQKANSVADLAYVLSKQHDAWKQEQVDALKALRDYEDRAAHRVARFAELKQRMIQLRPHRNDQNPDGEEYRRLKSEKMKLKRALNAPNPEPSLRTTYDMDGITIAWYYPPDAEFAATWPKEVIHHRMFTGENNSRYIAPDPSTTRIEPSNVKQFVEGKEQSEAIRIPDTKFQTLLQRIKFGREVVA